MTTRPGPLKGTRTAYDPRFRILWDTPAPHYQVGDRVLIRFEPADPATGMTETQYDPAPQGTVVQAQPLWETITGDDGRDRLHCVWYYAIEVPVAGGLDGPIRWCTAVQLSRAW